MELKKYKLGEIGNIQMCKRILKSETNPYTGIPFYKIGTFGKNADSFIDPQLYHRYRNTYSFPKKGDVLISAAGTIGRSVIYNGEDAYFQDSNIVWIEHDQTIVLNEYLYYVLNSIHWTPSKGSTILRLYNDDIKNKEVYLPSISIQKVVSLVLSNIDHKIKVNRAINQNLEAMAKQLYDYWFVQFDFPEESASLEVMLWAYGLGGLNQHIFKVTSANDFPKSFYYFQLLDYVNVFKKMAEARKTTMGHITQDHLQQSTIAIPDNKDIADKFEELISPIFKQIVKLQEEISNFIKQRDELLPLLMNGQITIE